MSDGGEKGAGAGLRLAGCWRHRTRALVGGWGVGGVVRVAAGDHLQLIFAQPEEGGVMESHIFCHCVVGGQKQISCSLW